MRDREMTFGAWLRGRRAERGQRQEVAAKACRVGRHTWQSWEADKTHPKRIKHLTAIAQWAQLDPEVVLALLPNSEDGPGPGL